MSETDRFGKAFEARSAPKGLTRAQVEEMASKLARKYDVAHTDEEADIRAVAGAFLMLVHDGEEFKKWLQARMRGYKRAAKKSPLVTTKQFWEGSANGIQMSLEKLASLESGPLEPPASKRPRKEGEPE